MVRALLEKTTVATTQEINKRGEKGATGIGIERLSRREVVRPEIETDGK